MARDITVTFDDGSTHVYRGAPDDITPEQVSARAAQEFGRSVKSLDGGRKAEMPSPDSRSWQQRLLQDAAAGLIRGAGSIGATLMAPKDYLNDLAFGDKGARNTERRQGMDAALSTLGADTNSLAFGGGKLAGEIAGTAGVGSALAGGLKLLPGAAKVAPFIDAVRTAGFKSGGLGGMPGFATRAAGGGITGATSAGLVDPEYASGGGVIGAALPGMLQGAGKVGAAAGRVIRGPEQAPELAAAIRAAQGQGYVIPPSQAKPSLVNRTLEGFSGKLTTAQNASAKNQVITNRLAAETLGLPTDVPITKEVLTTVRDMAGAKYATIGNTGMVTPGQAYTKALDDIAAPHIRAMSGFPNAKPSPVISMVESLKSPSFDAASAVAKIKELRSAADDAFRTGNTDIGRASKSAARALEDSLDDHLVKLGQPDLLKQFRDARQLIAKTYSVEKALNSTTGTVDAQKLAAQLNRGKPLSGGLKDAADFANRFKTASRPVEAMGSLPQTSPLDWAFAGGLTAATSNPLGLVGLMARPAARAATLSPMVQKGLLQGPMSPSIFNDELARYGLLAGPILGTDL